MDIKVGDKVRVHGNRNARKEWVGTEGIVTFMPPNPAWDVVKIKLTKPTDPDFSVGHIGNVTLTNLELVQEFTFEDVRKGDKLRQTTTYPTGTTIIREGVADALRWGYWVDSSDNTLAYENERENIKLELLERPEPKHWAYTKPVGSLALHTVVKGDSVTAYRKLSDTEWEINIITYGKICPKSTKALAYDLRNLTEDSSVLEWVK